MLDTAETHKLAQHAFPELVEMAQARSERVIGIAALASSVEILPVEEVNPTTLMASIQEAALGNAEALARVERNVHTDVAERLFKAGHITFVPLERTPRGLEQNGVPLSSIHRNTLEHMPLNGVMRERTLRELGNGLLFEEMDTAGILEEHDAVVFSAVPTDPETRRDYNFFTDTDSLSIQYLKKTGKSSFVMETAMVAGKTDSNAPRHDLYAIERLLEEAGMDQSYFDENEALSFVMLVKRTPQSGVHDIVERFDQIIGGTFFGEHKLCQDYRAYRKVCAARQQQFEGVVAQVTNELLAEAHTFNRPYDVIRRLDELSDLYCIKRAANDRTVDVRVFGAEAASHIEQMRLAIDQEDIFSADMHMAFARKTSTSSSCPFFERSSEEPNQEGKFSADCEFVSQQCPECGTKNVKTLVKQVSETQNRITGSCGCKKVVKRG